MVITETRLAVITETRLKVITEMMGTRRMPQVPGRVFMVVLYHLVLDGNVLQPFSSSNRIVARSFSIPESPGPDSICSEITSLFHSEA